MTWADQTLVGNCYSRDDVVAERGRFRRIDERVVSAAEISDQLPELPTTPQRVTRPVFSVSANANAKMIQVLLDKAAGLAGQRPVVHLPMGAFDIDSTLTIPRGSDLQLVGDGASEVATRLVWKGADGGRLLVIEGPTRATVRDLQLQAGGAQALVVELPDTPGAVFSRTNSIRMARRSSRRAAPRRCAWTVSATRRCCCEHCKGAAMEEPGSPWRGRRRRRCRVPAAGGRVDRRNRLRGRTIRGQQRGTAGRARRVSRTKFGCGLRTPPDRTRRALHRCDTLFLRHFTRCRDGGGRQFPGTLHLGNLHALAGRHGRDVPVRTARKRCRSERAGLERSVLGQPTGHNVRNRLAERGESARPVV